MAKLKGLPQLNAAIENLKSVAEGVRETLDEKRSWWDEKTERWQESDAGQAWDEHLNQVESILDEIDNLESLEA